MGNIRILKPDEQLEKKVVQYKPNPYMAVDEEGNILDFVDIGKVYAGREYSPEVEAHMAENERMRAVARTPNIFREYNSSRRIERRATEAANEAMKKMLESPDFCPKYLP